MEDVKINYTCLICNKKCANLKGLSLHCRKKHKISLNNYTQTYYNVVNIPRKNMYMQRKKYRQIEAAGSSIQCNICKLKFKTWTGLSNHIRQKHHLTSKDYYDMFNNVGKCIKCGKLTRFKNINIGYFRYCSLECSNFDPRIIKKKINKMYQTLLDKYGTKHTMQIPEFKRKSNTGALKLTNYILPSGKIIKIQGSYERDFLNFALNQINENEFDFDNIPFFSYYMNNQKHIYYPDFYIKTEKLIVEIKSTYTQKLQGEEQLRKKEESVLNNGYNYITILNKNYNEFINKYGEK